MGNGRADVRRARAQEREQNALRASRGLVVDRLFPDDAEQLDYELRHLYLHVVPIPQRESMPLRRHAFLPAFLEDVSEQAHAVPRLQLLTAMVAVLTNQARQGSVQARPMREYEGSPNPRLRPDGATAWRGNVQNNTPAARRLMWWEVPGGSVEFARLAVHDDVRIAC
jgi:hypothetical protein